MGDRSLSFNDKHFVMRDGVFERVQEQPKPDNVIEFTDYAEVKPCVHSGNQPLRRSLFLSLLIVLKWVGAFFAYPFVIFTAALGISLMGMLQCLPEMIKELTRPASPDRSESE